MKKRRFACAVALLSCVSLLWGCGGEKKEAAASPEEKVDIRIGALSGPTAMGMVHMMEEAKAGANESSYVFSELSTDASALVAPLASGELDVAAMPANLASVLYGKMDGNITALRVCVDSVLYIVERGETVRGVGDLAGRTLYATGQGAVPEYTLRHVLKGSGLDPDKDLTIQWCADTTEALAYVSKADGAVAMLPQPFVTAAMAKVDDLRVAVDLGDEWERLEGTGPVTGVLVARRDFLSENEEEMRAFLADYDESVAYAKEEPEKAAALIGGYGIVGEEIALKALPDCGLVCDKGEEMKKELSGYLSVLFEEDPKSVGGSLPGDDFYGEGF